MVADTDRRAAVAEGTGTRIGVTGHRSLADGSAVERAVASLVAELPAPITCVSALAAGADQVVARAVLAAGGGLEVLVPSDGYEQSLPSAARAGMEDLLARAVRVDRLPYDRPGKEAYLAAGRLMLDRIDLLVAIWDEGPSRGSGGTADLVRRAQERGLPVRVITADRGAAPD